MKHGVNGVCDCLVRLGKLVVTQIRINVVGWRLNSQMGTEPPNVHQSAPLCVSEPGHDRENLIVWKSWQTKKFQAREKVPDREQSLALDIVLPQRAQHVNAVPKHKLSAGFSKLAQGNALQSQRAGHDAQSQTAACNNGHATGDSLPTQNARTAT
jgi:hypothetical protein